MYLISVGTCAKLNSQRLANGMVRTFFSFGIKMNYDMISVPFIFIAIKSVWATDVLH